MAADLVEMVGLAVVGVLERKAVALLVAAALKLQTALAAQAVLILERAAAAALMAALVLLEVLLPLVLQEQAVLAAQQAAV